MNLQTFVRESWVLLTRDELNIYTNTVVKIFSVRKRRITIALKILTKHPVKHFNLSNERRTQD